MGPSADPPFVHPSSIVDEGVVLGAGVRIWHFVHVCAGAQIGEGVALGQGVYVGPGVRIGRGTRVQNHVSVYEGVELGEDVFVGPNAVFTNVRHPRAHVRRRHAFENTQVARRATIGANATIVCGVTLDEACFVAAGAVVTRSVPPRVLVMGAPARAVGHVCDCGERVAVADKAAACAACGARYVSRADGGLDPAPQSR